MVIIEYGDVEEGQGPGQVEKGIRVAMEQPWALSLIGASASPHGVAARRGTAEGPWTPPPDG